MLRECCIKYSNQYLSSALIKGGRYLNIPQKQLKGYEMGIRGIKGKYAI